MSAIPNDGPNHGRPIHRVVCYCQTYFPNNSNNYVSLLPLLRNNCGASHIILAAIHINSDPNNITLNDDSPYDNRYAPLWAEARVAQAMGVKVMGMLGGAARGSFERLDQDDITFEKYYAPLRGLIRARGLDGLDLDVEEETSLNGIIRLIDQLKADFGSNFIITLAPVASGLIYGLRHLSGFSYFSLELERGSSISWYNTQFYNGWQMIDNLGAYDGIMRCGWNPNKVVVGLLTNQSNGSQGYIPPDALDIYLPNLVERYPTFGGVMGWEYYNSMPGNTQRPWLWAARVSLLMGLRILRDIAYDFSSRSSSSDSTSSGG